ncbi:hypothetical protein QFZ77_005401 [Paenibacillus sp. V4I3]|uniref:hypothetical protein n=1 Tax=Paenibacillus sp. V4I3 TaxID=3042305 RepID=UPI002785C3D9|nr:hypothetical protein [Paenibacillus sp. V4I3]MDQ0876742.1 hypothetical protein [Paenibacillus sp. V4I3]
MYGQTQIETSKYVAQYIKDRYGKDISPEELYHKLPWHEIVWQKFFAYAFYKVKDYYFSWDEVPEPVEGMYAKIISKEILENYQYRGGKWWDIGSATASCWK